MEFSGAIATVDEEELTFELPKSLLSRDGFMYDEDTGDESAVDDTETGGQASTVVDKNDAPTDDAADEQESEGDLEQEGKGDDVVEQKDKDDDVVEQKDKDDDKADTIVVATLENSAGTPATTAVMDGDTIVIDKSPVEDHAVKYTVKQLRDILKANQLATNGGKGALVQRLVDHQIQPFYS